MIARIMALTTAAANLLKQGVRDEGEGLLASHHAPSCDHAGWRKNTMKGFAKARERHQAHQAKHAKEIERCRAGLTALRKSVSPSPWLVVELAAAELQRGNVAYVYSRPAGGGEPETPRRLGPPLPFPAQGSTTIWMRVILQDERLPPPRMETLGGEKSELGPSLVAEVEVCMCGC
ncbi:MAG: hypothetical protein HY904_26345 [Deltaproteobacteria bacterium]|nr:hypothetical protein [Deltaproteobacteria bacterium]